MILSVEKWNVWKAITASKLSVFQIELSIECSILMKCIKMHKNTLEYIRRTIDNVNSDITKSQKHKSFKYQKHIIITMEEQTH